MTMNCLVAELTIQAFVAIIVGFIFAYLNPEAIQQFAPKKPI